MNDNEQRKILVETVKRFGNQQWFRDAAIHDVHPITKEPTLEFKVNYVPRRILAEIKTFVLHYNLVERFTEVDKNGNPVE